MTDQIKTTLCATCNGAGKLFVTWDKPGGIGNGWCPCPDCGLARGGKPHYETKLQPWRKACLTALAATGTTGLSSLHVGQSVWPETYKRGAAVLAARNLLAMERAGLSEGSMPGSPSHGQSPQQEGRRWMADRSRIHASNWHSYKGLR